MTGLSRPLPGTGSGMSVAIMDAAGDYAATIVSGANLAVPTDPVESEALWTGVGLVVLQNEVPETLNLSVARAARARGIKTLLNAAPVRALSPEFATLVDILVVNAVEAEMMGAAEVCCLPSAADAAKVLADRFDCVVVTAGSKGLAAWTSQDEMLVIPAEKVDVVSSHGAGDAFIGTLAAGILGGSTFSESCKRASVAASRHVAGLAE